MKKALSIFLTLALSVAMLSGCGKSSSGAKNAGTAKKPVTASQAFYSESIWYAFDSDHGVAKDEKIGKIIVCDGQGNATVYNTSGAEKKLTFADLKDLSDDDILSLAKKKDEESFHGEKDRLINRLESEINNYKAPEEVPDKETYFNIFYKDQIGYSGSWKDTDDQNLIAIMEFNYQKELKNYAKRVEENNKMKALKDKISAIEYKEPVTHSLQLAIKTDSTGNNASEETLTCTYNQAKFDYNQDYTIDESQEKDWPFTEQSAHFELGTLGNLIQKVYDMSFGGYEDLVTKLDKVGDFYQGFTWDTPDTKGIQVD